MIKNIYHGDELLSSYIYSSGDNELIFHINENNEILLEFTDLNCH